jgi:Zn-dependent membrane protease YugP
MTPSSVIFGTIGVLMALIGLLMAASAKDDAFYIAGLIMFVAFVLFLFTLVKRHFDAADAARKDEAGH